MVAWLFGNKKTQPSTKNDDFVSLSSHELRAPLSIIKWYTEMLLDGDPGPLTEDQRKYLTVIETSNQRAIDLVRSLLNVSRIDLGTFRIEPKLVQVGSLVDKVCGSVTEIASKKNIKLTTRYEEGIPDSMLDESLSIFIFRHVISNAIFFSKEGGEVTISTKLLPGGESITGHLLPEKSVIVIIHDSGIGIPENDQDKIFTKMYRASNVNDTTGTGSGLGLYMVKQVCQFFGGDIWFTSSQDEGTSFYLAIPCKGMVAKEGKTTLD